ncbi:MAG: U32 family peptidase [Erysipelotrichaceae bacterium]|jgi:putative protease|nr:U32 family peptidase [Erysipelotrichaceae bacterium]MCR5096223.1 U32 family peptidase [Erysipelotrichaceae bacterium]
MNKVELLAPAKDLAKAKIAIMYGADAVYVGGKFYSLRSRASNFDLNDLKELSSFAKQYKAKVYVTVNIVFHDDDYYGIKQYLQILDSIGIDGIIISSLGLIPIVKQIAPHLECHISTQLSSLNSSAVELLKSFGADRVVLGREASMDQIEEIARKVDVPLEVFIHGGMCSNYSGRCVLSNRMTLRDANRGGCAHSCRWKYHLFDGDKIISNPNCLLSMSSKDLRASAYVERMIRSNIASLKIEGRMKSEYYIGQVVKTYRKMIDEIYSRGYLNEDRLEYYDNELSKAENRPSDDGFLSGSCDNTKHLYGVNGAGVTHDYVAYVHGYDDKRGIALIEVKNVFARYDDIEVFGPDVDNERFKVEFMFDDKWNEVELANKPTQLLYIRMPFKVHKGDMFRRISL